MGKSLVEMTQEIVQAQVSAKHMSVDEIKAACTDIFQTLRGLQNAEVGGAETTEETSEGINLEPKKSILRAKIVCMECGQEFKMLSPKHLASHGLDAKSYRKKYGFAARQPLCAKALSDRRSQSAKDRGLPDNLRKYLDSRAKKEAPESPVEDVPAEA